MSKKKIAVIIIVIVLVLAGVAAGVWLWFGKGAGGSGEDKVYVEAVSLLTNTDYGTQNRYSGVVEPQESVDIKRDTEKQIKEIFVEEGQEVTEGTPLFEYDTDTIADEIAQAKLELEGIKNEISDYYGQIEALQAERNMVSEDEKFQYTTQIQSLQTAIKQSEYNKKSKELEIERKEESQGNAVVNSEIAGIVKSISEEGYDMYTGQELPFMTILGTGQFRVKGTINEQNVWTITPGSPVIIRSRIDEEQTWSGIITEVDTNSEVTNNNNYYYDSGMGETATKYPFYIELDSAEGLILGQHVYIEMDMGQSETKEGIWLYESYIVTDESGSYVWADNGKQKLEKRMVELGEYDMEMGTYQILSGLTEEDYIAYPMATLYEGVTTVTDAMEVDYSSPMYMEEAAMWEEGMMEDGMMEEDMLMEIPLDESMLEDMPMEMPMDESMLEEGVIDESMLEDGISEEDIIEESVEPEVSE